MKEDFFKFPPTPHWAILPGVDIRGDKVLTESERHEFLQHALVVEEKVDGANLGISFDSDGNIRLQSRGAYLQLPGIGQWKKLGEWIRVRADVLFDHLSDRFILFGEWCYARHSVFYDHLPDWFLAFDLYDRASRRFLSSERRNKLMEKMSLAKVPCLGTGRFSFSELTSLLSHSRFTDQPAEGIYLRFDCGDWLEQRAKLVRPAFIQAVDRHWSRFSVRPNRICVRHVEEEGQWSVQVPTE